MQNRLKIFLDETVASGAKVSTMSDLKTLAMAKGADSVGVMLKEASIKDQVEIKTYLKQAASGGAVSYEKGVQDRTTFIRAHIADFPEYKDIFAGQSPLYTTPEQAVREDDFFADQMALLEGQSLSSPEVKKLYDEAVSRGQEEGDFTEWHNKAYTAISSVAKKTATLIFGEDRKAIAKDDATAFGLDGKDKTLPTEGQKKIYTPEPVKRTYDLAPERADFRKRQETDVWHPTTSDIKAAADVVAEALKEKPDFPEILNRAEKDPVGERDAKSAKEKSAAKVIAEYKEDQLRKLLPVDEYGIDVQFSSSKAKTTWMLLDEELLSVLSTLKTELLTKAAAKKTASLAEELDGAKLVKRDADSGTVFAWFGGDMVHIYDESGYELDVFSFPETHRNEQAVLKMIEEHIAEGRNTGLERDGVRKQGSIKDELLAAGIKPEQMDSHESDLYVIQNDISSKVLENYEFKENVTTFRSQTDGKLWFDIPFANDTWWDKRVKAKTEFPFSTEDSVLDGFTYQDVIDATISNEEVRNPEAIGRTFEDMLKKAVQDAKEVFNTNFKKVLSEVTAYTARGAKKVAEDTSKTPSDIGKTTHKELPGKPETSTMPPNATTGSTETAEAKGSDIGKTTHKELPAKPETSTMSPNATTGSVEPAAAPATLAYPATGVPSEKVKEIKGEKKVAVDIKMNEPVNIKDPTGMDRRMIPTGFDVNTNMLTLVPEGTDVTTIKQ